MTQQYSNNINNINTNDIDVNDIIDCNFEVSNKKIVLFNKKVILKNKNDFLIMFTKEESVKYQIGWMREDFPFSKEDIIILDETLKTFEDKQLYKEGFWWVDKAQITNYYPSFGKIKSQISLQIKNEIGLK